MGPYSFFLIPVVGSIGLFSFCAIAIWAINRRRERESLYHGETVRKISETHGQQAVFDYLREIERIRTRRLQSAYTVGGIVAACGGAGLTLFLFPAYSYDHTYLVGMIPLLVGLGLLAYTRFTPKL